MKKGLTLLEVLVAMFILVIVFGLVTFLYVKAASIRKIVVANSEIQQTLSQMMDTIIHGEKNTLGLCSAYHLNSAESNPNPSPPYKDVSHYVLVFSDKDASNTGIYAIAPGATAGNPSFSSTDTDTTLWRYDTTSGKWQSLDINNKITLVSGSKFDYYDSGGGNILDEHLDTETTLVKITLKAKSNEPALSNKAPVTLKTAIRLRNALPF